MNKKSIFSVLQRIGQSFMFPIAILPIAGLMLGIGASFSNSQMIFKYGLDWLLGEKTFLFFVLTIMKETGEIVFANLPIIFSMGVALGMAKKEKEVSCLSSAIAFLIMHKTISSLLYLTGKLEPGALLEGTIDNVCGIPTLQMSVFGGVIVGLGVAYLHNKFYKIKLPAVLSFFGGVRFIPIISACSYILVGTLMFFIWPHIQMFMNFLGEFVTSSKYVGKFIYGFTERALIPFGLHPVFYSPFWYTSIGGTAVIDGINVTGAQKIFFAELASQSTRKFTADAAVFMGGKFPFMLFGLPAAALAMYKTAKPHKKKLVGGLLLSAALTCFLTGITEPIEFTFLFLAPVLYFMHCIFAGLSFMFMYLLNIAIGTTFSAGLIDFFLFGILQGNAKTNWVMTIPLGIVYAILYYFVFIFFIKKFNLMTPGREEDELDPKLFTKKDFNSSRQNGISELIIKGLGDIENIVNLDCCATRLRVIVSDVTKIDDNILKQSGSVGIIKKGDAVQIIYGTRVTIIKSELEDYISDIKIKNNQPKSN
ncbi:MAG: PTS transporter subunit IIABC [Candidatus Improbicoccus pseudotrichonymphae]|uniref:PTS transporter subunit IIABC n=1 Tax=Candidatus Improbicoccus pseudotrichonymphae TaxID=3033792 RepID=A0AA48HYA1_9FIRM|nr:MAG: PTS transporter subunit IIABC [Candidatus Improbicoccus pseudotrichonymphae]